MQVHRIASMKIETARPGETLFEVARKMKLSNIGFLPVVDEMNRPIGVITDRDLVVRGMAEGRSPVMAHAQDIMSEPVWWIYEDAEIEHAVREMARKNVRRLLVRNHAGAAVGVLSLDDLALFTHGDETAGRVLESIARRIPVPAGAKSPLDDWDD